MVVVSDNKKHTSKRYKSASVAFLAISLLATMSNALFSGFITADNSEINASGVTYSFTLAFESTIPSDGKLVLRFPVNFTESFSNPVCTAITGFSSAAGTNLNCEYLPSIRLFTIDQGFPSTFTELEFSISGVVNPAFANETEFFTVDSYYTSGGDFVPLESSNAFITIVPDPGVLSGETMSLADTTVG